jgi:hypothetical protein
VLLLYPHHPHLSLDHCSPVGLDYLIHHHLYDYLDQDLVRVEYYHLGMFLKVDYLDIVRFLLSNPHKGEGNTIFLKSTTTLGTLRQPSPSRRTNPQ